MLTAVSKSETYCIYEWSSGGDSSLYFSKGTAVENLLKRFKNCLEPNWDGDGAQPISLGTLQNARRFLRQLPRGTPEVDAAPGIDGSIGMFWETPDTYIYVDVKPDGRVHYYYQLENEQPQEDVLATPFNGQVLYQCLARAFSFMMSKKQPQRGENSTFHTIKILTTASSFLNKMIISSTVDFHQFVWI